MEKKEGEIIMEEAAEHLLLQQRISMGEKMYVAVGKDVRESKSNLIWALHNSGGKKICLLHVHQPANMIPIMGGKFPASKCKEEEVRAYRDREKEKMNKSINDYMLVCSHVGVRADKLITEADSIEKGIIELVAQHEIKILVMGAAADKQYSKKMTMLRSKKAISVCQQAHVQCHILFVCKGYLIHTRESSLGKPDIGFTPLQVSVPVTEPSQSDRERVRSLSERDHVRLTNPVQDLFRRVKSENFDSPGRVAALPSPEEMRVTPTAPDLIEGIANEWKEMSGRSPAQGSDFSTWTLSEVVGMSDSISVMKYEESEDGFILPAVHEFEEDLRYSSTSSEPAERRISDEMYDQLQQAMAETEDSKREALEESVRRQKAERYALEAMSKAKASESLYTNGVKQRKEMEEMLARETLKLEEMKCQQEIVTEELKAAREQKWELEKQLVDSDQTVKELEEKIVSAVELLKTSKKQRDEILLERDSAVREAEELRSKKEKGTTITISPQFFTEFSFMEIGEATQSFDPSLIIGEGGYGNVFKGLLRNTEVAIKMLHSDSLQGRSEFQQEVEVLSRVRHPNLVTLIGTCPEAWALIYEYLPGGSLDDRLSCKNNTPPLSWQTRTRIAVEICSALIFLHSNNPDGIIHGDLKPANVLLDTNFVSKLGDFGICRLIPHEESHKTTFCTTSPKGTLAYMDPEFLSTGELSPKSDVYSFGLILLRLLTGKPAMGLVKEVEYALEKDNLSSVLDVSAGAWPFVQAKQLTHLALRCCEMNRKSRPNLESEVWRVLEPLKTSYGGVSLSFWLGSEDHCQAPSYFICPILQEVMQDPYIAADGFTYEAEALKGWLESGHDTSPMTNLKLEHQNLVPNHSLRSAIQEWLQHR